MAISQMIQWVALPNGSTGEGAQRRLRLSVFVSPRLRADADQDILDSFPDFRDWPATVRALTFQVQVEVENGPLIPAQVVSQAPESRLWAALFTPKTPVESFTFDDFADRPLVTYSVRNLLGYLKGRYARVAMSASDLPAAVQSRENPNAPSLAGIFGELVNLPRSHLLQGLPDDQELGLRIGSLLAAARQEAAARRANPQNAPRTAILVETGGNDATAQFEQSLLFHRRLAGTQPVDLPDDQEAPQHFRERVDFHQMLSALGDYPQLLRRLGLVIDLEIDAAALPETPDAARFKKLRVVPTERSADMSPWTAYLNTIVQDMPIFLAGARRSPALLGLTDTDYMLTQVDVDGAAIKAMNMAVTLAHQADVPERPIEEPEKAGIPALRTSGISLVRNGKALDMHQNFLVARDQNEAIERGPLPTLFAEDVTRGYRMDVFDGAVGHWRSLHERIVSYHALTFPDGPFDIADEGLTQLSTTGSASAKDAPPDPNSELYVHESLFTWDGWSLSAPRPGKSISRSPRAPDPGDSDTQPGKVFNKAMTSMALEVTARTQPGSLPRLRFEHPYRVRVRMVDLAGNSVTVKEADDLLTKIADAAAALPQQDALAYARFEPVAAPVLIPRTAYAEGESLERLVIRSDRDTTAAEYAARDPNRYANTEERHLAAPKAALALVETHGMLDAAFDAQAQGLPQDQVRQIIKETYELARREKGSLDDEGPQVELVRKDGVPDGPVVYAIHRETQLEVPYLPDPLARGVVLTGLPGADPTKPFVLEYSGPAWHQPTPLRLRLAEGAGEPEWDETERVLTVRAGKAQIVKARAMSLIPVGYFKAMGLFHWCEEAMQNGTISPADFDAIVKAAEENRHWMLTPWREITLVHAVQHPLKAPRGEFGRLQPGDPRTWQRSWGQTRAELTVDVELDFASTARLDLNAAWQEPRDRPQEGAPRYGENLVPVTAHVLDIAIPASGAEPRLIEEDRLALAFLDGKRVLFDASTLPNIVGSLRQHLATTPGLTPQQRDDLRRRIELLEQVRPHEFGDTQYRRVRYRFTATSRFREYFPTEITKDSGNLSLSSQEAVIDVLSSAPPTAPKVLYAIPTWRWETGQDEATGARTSTRSGGGVRVYLDRPWFSSGEGELVGVVLPGNITGASAVEPTDPEYPYVTLWGQDPIWSAPGLPSPGLASFKNAVQIGERLPLLEMPEQPVWVVGFPVAFDADRGLWYCDIEIDTEAAYGPFVRLALVRYQPHSIPGAHLSRVVLADTVQTVPNRTLAVTQNPSHPGVVGVQVSGPAYTAMRRLDNQIMQATSQMQARLEVRDAGIADETLGWEAGPDASVVLQVQPAPTGSATIWRGQVTVPTALQGQTVRLVVEESEQLFTENLENPQGGFTLGVRLVYADVMKL